MTSSDTSLVEGGTERGRVVLPVMGVDALTSRGADGNDHQTIMVKSTHSVLRTCDHCDLADAPCPSFTAGASCAYEIPVEIHTKVQLQRLWQALIEMQAKRVLMARFSEEVEGTVSPILSNELDRFSRLSDGYMRAIDDRETVSLRVEAHAGAGVMTRLFGGGVGSTAAALPGGPLPPQVVDSIVHEAMGDEFDEAEVLDPADAT